MKLNELNQIEEGIFSAIKDRFQQGGYQTQVQNIFITDFVQDAITSLNNGIKGGLIDPNVKTTGPGTTPDAPKAANRVKGEVVALNGKDYRWEGAQWLDIATGRVADKATAQKLSSMPVTPLARGKIVNLNGKNYRWEGAQWVDTTTGRVADKATGQQLTSAFKGQTATESTYDKMNRVFESIINVEEQAGLRTIADYMMEWFTRYMEGVDWQSSKAAVQQKIEKLQAEYPKNAKQNLTDLARMGLALSKAGSPAGAPDEFRQSQTQQQTSSRDARNIKDELDDLARTNPRAYNEIIRDLKPARTGFMYEDNQ